jgi:hypothetical protein
MASRLESVGGFWINETKRPREGLDARDVQFSHFTKAGKVHSKHRARIRILFFIRRSSLIYGLRSITLKNALTTSGRN